MSHNKVPPVNLSQPTDEELVSNLLNWLEQSGGMPKGKLVFARDDDPPPALDVLSKAFEARGKSIQREPGLAIAHFGNLADAIESQDSIALALIASGAKQIVKTAECRSLIAAAEPDVAAPIEATAEKLANAVAERGVVFLADTTFDFAWQGRGAYLAPALLRRGFRELFQGKSFIALQKTPSDQPEDAYLFSHHKCATNWMRLIFPEYCRELGLSVLISRGLARGVHLGRNRRRFFFVVNAVPLDAATMRPQDRAVHLVRDPRDAFVSQYFSWKSSHKNNTPIMQEHIGLFGDDDKENIERMLDLFLFGVQARDWSTREGVLELRYEGLLEDTLGQITKAVRHLNLPEEPELLARLVENASFEKITGRKRGQESLDNRQMHYRKGVWGDWVNHFTPELKAQFKERYGDLVARLGYERDVDW